MWTVLLLAACSGDPAPATSTPVPPTVDLTPAPQPDTEWTNLAGLLPPEPGLPLPVRALAAGMPAADAERVLAAASVAGTKPKEKRLGGRTLHTTLLDGFPMVQVTAVLTEDSATVDTIQINMPSAEGESALVRAWGPADGLVFGDGSNSQYVWTGPRHTFHWKNSPEDPVGLLLIERFTP